MTAFQQRDVALEFVEKRRAAIPYATDQIALMLRLVRALVVDPNVILDLGCGDGILARALLATYPNATAILLDHSSTMLEKAEALCAGFAGRFGIIEGDLTHSLRSLIGARNDIDVVVSGFAIHHLTHQRKHELYEEIFKTLKPGGLFVNIEHVASVDTQIEQIWDDALVEHIAAVQQIGFEQARAEYISRPDRNDNILAPVELQTQWLREIGFTHVDCYFKWFELAVFGGQKPN